MLRNQIIALQPLQNAHVLIVHSAFSSVAPYSLASRHPREIFKISLQSRFGMLHTLPFQRSFCLSVSGRVAPSAFSLNREPLPLGFESRCVFYAGAHNKTSKFRLISLIFRALKTKAPVRFQPPASMTRGRPVPAFLHWLQSRSAQAKCQIQ